MSTPRTTAGALLAAAALGAGCGSDDHRPAGAAAAPAGGAAVAASDTGATASVSDSVAFKLDEYSIAPFAATARAGRVTITVSNDGDKTHELLVVRATGKLKVKGGRVDEGALEKADRVVGEISDVAPGKAGKHTFTLRRGSYMVFCNLPGHYRAGMRGTLVVRAVATGA
jgi:uncharacterized cupredoxin-like copper-binding protein